MKNKLQSRIKSLQKKYKTENNNIIKSEIIFHKVRLLEFKINQHQTEKNISEIKKIWILKEQWMIK